VPGGIAGRLVPIGLADLLEIPEELLPLGNGNLPALRRLLLGLVLLLISAFLRYAPMSRLENCCRRCRLLPWPLRAPERERSRGAARVLRVDRPSARPSRRRGRTARATFRSPRAQGCSREAARPCGSRRSCSPTSAPDGRSPRTTTVRRSRADARRDAGGRPRRGRRHRVSPSTRPRARPARLASACLRDLRPRTRSPFPSASPPPRRTGTRLRVGTKRVRELGHDRARASTVQRP
jgi:hypothetical protein